MYVVLVSCKCYLLSEVLKYACLLELCYTSVTTLFTLSTLSTLSALSTLLSRLSRKLMTLPYLQVCITQVCGFM